MTCTKNFVNFGRCDTWHIGIERNSTVGAGAGSDDYDDDEGGQSGGRRLLPPAVKDASASSQPRPARKSTSHFRLAANCGRNAWNPCGRPRYLGREYIDLNHATQNADDAHIELGLDAVLTEEPFVEEGFVTQGVEAADLNVSGRKIFVG